MTARQATLLVALAALWGASFLFMRIAAPSLGAVWLIELRVLLAGLALLPLIMLQGHLGILWRYRRGLMFAGLMNAALPFSLLAWVSIELNAGLTSILNATVPIFGALYALLVRHQSLGIARWSGVLLGFAGVALLALADNAALPPLAPLPLAAGLLAAGCYALAANFTRDHLQDVPPLAYVVGSQLYAALLLLPLLPFFTPAQWPQGEELVLVAGSTLGLALLSTSLAFWAYFHLIHAIGPTRTLTVTYLIPVFAVAWGALLLNEPVTLSLVSGAMLIIAGTKLANRG